MDEAKLIETIKKYEFYHIFQLTETIATPGWKEFLPLQKPIHQLLQSLDLKGRRFLDIGCRDGLFSFEAEKLGASEVIGIDNDLSLAATQFLIPYFNSNIKMHELNLLDLTPELFGKFDVILFAGVLYHLRYPFWALKRIVDILNEGGTLIIETGVFVDDNRRPLLRCPVGAESPYEPTSCTFFNLKGLSDTLFSLGLVTEQASLLDTQVKIEVELPRNQPIRIPLTNEQIEHLAPPTIKLDSIPAEGFDRATILCRKDSSVILKNVAKYWDAVHYIHNTNKLG